MHARQGYGPVPVENSNLGNIDDVVPPRTGLAAMLRFALSAARDGYD